MENNIVRTDYDLQQGDRYRLLPTGDSTPTDPKWQEYDRKLKAQKRKGKQQVITTAKTMQPIPVSQEKMPVALADSSLTPEEEILIRATNERYKAGVGRGERHKTFMMDSSKCVFTSSSEGTKPASLAFCFRISVSIFWST